MKCEICHDADAVAAITRVVNGAEEELYVCQACADSEHKARQKKSQRTRKSSEMHPGLSISVQGSGEPPPFIDAIIRAMHGIVGEIEQAAIEHAPPPRPEPELQTFPISRVNDLYRIGKRIHLEGLYLIGELPAVKRALHAVNMELVGLEIDCMIDVGHVFEIRYQGAEEHAAGIVAKLVQQERNARTRLLGDMHRVFSDSLCRALAILKNCRLVSSAEVFDLLSPLRLAAYEKLLDGISLSSISLLQRHADLSDKDADLSVPERDRLDAERADEMNRKFEDVVLNERAEEQFL